MPVKLTVCGLSAALSVMTSDALRDPVAWGVKVTLIAQLDPAAKPPPQLLVCANSIPTKYSSAMLEMLSGALPVLESVIVWGAVVEPMFSWLKARPAGDRLTTGAGGGAEVPPPPPPPPPQAAQPPTKNAVANSQADERRAVAKFTSAARARNPVNSQGH